MPEEAPNTEPIDRIKDALEKVRHRHLFDCRGPVQFCEWQHRDADAAALFIRTTLGYIVGLAADGKITLQRDYSNGHATTPRDQQAQERPIVQPK